MPRRNFQRPTVGGNAVLFHQWNLSVFGDGKHANGVSTVLLNQVTLEMADLG